MNVIFYEGPAGTGKTFNLMKELQQQIGADALKDGQKVLGLTFMHGSRRRLIERFKKVTGLNGRFHCSTFDSFAWNLVKRWRSLAIKMGLEILKDQDYEETCRNAAALLARPEVCQWVEATYPMIIVDETQDCKDGRLQIIQQLAKRVTILAAADEFQDLRKAGLNEAVSWLRSVSQPVQLSDNHRAESEDLIIAATCLYNNYYFRPGKTSKYQILTAVKAPLAAWHIATTLKEKKTRDVAILTPTKPANSPFVKGAIQRVVEAPFYKPTKRGPYMITWEEDSAEIEKRISEGLCLDANPNSLLDISFIEGKGCLALKQWAKEQRRLSGRTEVTISEVKTSVSQIAQRTRAYSTGNSKGFRAMTIHQAKNREFEGVIVVWPYEVVKEPESLRRLLYNAITRAKKWVTVIVQQDPKKLDRLTKPPFAPLEIDATTRSLPAFVR